METYRSWLLLVGTSGPFLVLGFIAGGLAGAAVGLLLCLALALCLFAVADRVVLNVSRAVPLTKEDAPHLFSAARGLASWASLPTPGLYVVQAQQPNAFVLGIRRGRAAIVLTSGLLELMDSDELKGILAHKLTHIQHGDYRWSTFAACMASVAVLALERLGLTRRRETAGADGMTASFFAPLVHLSSSRGQDVRADMGAALLAGQPDGLVKALRKAGAVSRGHRVPHHMLPLYISQPLIPLRRLNRFNPRPDVEERIEHLTRNARRVSQP